MKSFGTYISKHLASFAAFLLILVIVNVVLYGVTFYHTVSEDYGEASPRAMLELTSTAATTEGLPDYAEQKLRQYNIWAMYLTSTGECFWRLDVPQEVPQHYSIQEVALFSKGYLEDYPVFVWSTEDGLLVLGYPKNSYMKLTSNYYSMETIQKIPLYVIGMLGMDVLCLFWAYYFSKRRIIQNTEPIVDAIETLADGKPVSLHIDRELSEIANSVNKASLILSRQALCGFSNTIPSMTKSIDDITTPPTFTIINSTIVDSKSQGEVPYISELDIACFSAIDNSR